MSEFVNTNDLSRYLDEVKQSENLFRGQARDYFLQSNLFHPRYDADIGERSALLVEFDLEHKDKNFGERFEMAIGSTYIDKIHIVELGWTDNIHSHGKSLKQDYKDLRDWLIAHDIIAGEMSREDSGRVFGVRIPNVTPPNEKIVQRLVVDRMRPLLRAQIRNSDGDLVDFSIAKHMVFCIPGDFLSLLAMRFGHEELKDNNWPEDMKQFVENLLHEYSHKQPIVHKIRTGYYLRSETHQPEAID